MLCIAKKKDQERSCNMGKKRSKMYSSNHNILLVGEGDFSFSLSLATRFGSASNIVATSLDSREELVRKYSKAEENLNVLENLGCKILHGIDVHTMSKRACLKRKLFDRIVFNFPHAGFFYRERDNRQIRLQQDLVRGFLINAEKMLEEDGEVHITHKTGYPYDEWGIENIAGEVGLFLKSQVPFQKDKYPGYENRRGDGAKCNKTFPVGRCSTFKFKKSASIAYIPKMPIIFKESGRPGRPDNQDASGQPSSSFIGWVPGPSSQDASGRPSSPSIGWVSGWDPSNGW